MADSSGYGLLQCLQKLSDEEFLLFKELLRKEPKKFKLKPISWPMIKNASKEDVVTLLNTHYPGKAPDVVMSLLRQLNRKDLVTVLRKQRRNKQNRYKGLMRTTFEEIWALETKTLVPDRSYHIIIKMQYQALLEVFRSKSEPVTAVVLGTTGEGKTTFLKKAMLNWALGILWEKRFQYVFFISVFSLNNIPELSLAELIASKLPKSSETPDDILSRPKRILFILDGFDYLKFDLELRTNLCDDWRKRLPTQIVLSSLLQKIMLPESSLLLELGNSSAPKIYPLLQYPRAITIGGFTADSIQFYCLSVFNYRQGLQVFENIRNCQLLLTLCRNPYFCWLFCSSLKWQLGSGEERDFVTGTDSGSYTTFLVNAFKSVYANTSLNTSRTLLRNLCSLAVEGMWKQAFVFDSEDLRRNGISEDNKGAWLRMEFLQKRGSHFVFYHPSLQSYFAALFYFLRQEKDAPHPVVGSLSQVLGELYAHGQTRWLQTGIFVFGIGNPRVTAMLQPVLGHLPFKEVKQEIIRYLRNLSQRQNSEKLLSPESLSFCLLDSQEEKFVKQAMGLFEEMTVDVSNSEILTVISYGLPRATKLKKLRLHIQNVVFSEYIDPEYYGTVETFTRDKLNAITHWRILCSIFHKLHVLDLDSCNFNKEAFQIFCESLSPSHIMEPENTFKLKSLSCSFMTNFGDGSLLKTFPQLPHLKSLNLYGTNLSVYMVEGLCSALSSPTCKVEVLLLGKCNISSEACGIIATSINYHKLRHLSLVENPLKDKGVMFLCEILKRPTCVLETLMLSYCCLTFIACGHLYDGILGSQHLSLLDLGSNFLEDTGANILCEALKDPMCLLQELWLSGCYFTSECCERLSATLTCSRNLKTLKLGNNDIQDTGVKQLCEALRHPNCKLQCLGLDMCELTTSCCEDLASALTTCKTLTNLNLDWIALDHNGLVVLCEALTSRHCRLKILGLDKSALSEESQKLLEDVQHHKKSLNILHYPWVEKERRERGVRLVWNSKN